MSIELNNKVDIIFQFPDNKSFKFGYYNYNPLSRDGFKLLAQKVPFEGRMPNADDEIEIGYFDFEKDGDWVKITNSSAFNWQQGSMLQWLGPDFNTKIIFNDYVDGKYIAKIVDIETTELRQICKAIYAVHPSGRFSISLHFERCNFTRAYSYAGVVDASWNSLLPEDDHLLRIDLIENNYTEIIRLSDVIDLTGTKNASENHWFEHIQMNQFGDRFSFYHRFAVHDGFFTNCLTADSDGSKIWLLPLQKGERISHLGWKNNKEFVVFTYFQSKVQQLWIGQAKANSNNKINPLKTIYRKIVKPFMPKSFTNKIVGSTLPHYIFLEDKVGRIGNVEIDPKGLDGHPSFSKCGRYMLTDTYADSNNQRHLLLHDLWNNRTIKLGSFVSFFNNCGWRADLHPRFSHDEQKVIIDVNYSGITQILVLNISKVYKHL